MLFGAIRLAIKVVLAAVAVVVVYFAVTLVQVYLTGRHYDPRPAGAAVVMGAAQYDGVPSPDLAARLDEALLLYRQGYVHTIMVTGYKEPGDLYTEAESGSRYLQAHGVPAHDILEAGGDDSWQNLAQAAPILRRHGIHVVLITTDKFHEDRSMAIATDVGLQPYPTPTQTSPITGWSAVPYYLKEMVAVGLGRIIGYQHLSELHGLE
jgi:uncharacterized SAM-binding protein YcdF (DUF218 family)